MKIILILFCLGSLIQCSGNSENKSVNQIDEPITSIANNIPLDSLLKNDLESIRIQDQTLRMLLPDVNNKFGKDSKEKAFFSRLLMQQDSICALRVREIVDKHGWISVDRVGYYANQAQWLVVQHADLKTQEHYLPLLRESVRTGGSEGWYLAFLEDRILMRNDKKQRYGSQALPNSTTGKTHIYPIKDVNTVNERREKLGLESIEIYAGSNGYVFDIAEHL